MLTILDEYTRESHVRWAERAMKAADVLHWLQKAVEQHGAGCELWLAGHPAAHLTGGRCR